MRYFAILKDSFREALDSVVLYVLIGLSTLIIVFVGTIGFRPLSAEQTMRQFFSDPRRSGGMIYAALNSHNPEKMSPENLTNMFSELSRFNLENVELLSGQEDSPASDYLLTVVYRPWHVEDRDGREGIQKIFKGAQDLDLIRVGTIELVPGGEQDPIRYRVTLHATGRTHRIWAAEPSLFFGAWPIESATSPMGFSAYVLAKIVLGIGAWVAVLMSVIITSFFIPNMLRKGTIDMMLVKPTHRWSLLLFKYLGGLTFIFLNAIYAVGGIWLILGLRTGLWANNALLMVFSLTFFFAILYAISTFVGVVTRSTIAAILLTFVVWFFYFLVGFGNSLAESRIVTEKIRADHNRPVPESERWTGSYSAESVAILQACLPRTWDLDYLDDLLVFTGFLTGNIMDIAKFDYGQHNWWLSFMVSTGWIAFYLTLACLWFSFKDY
jgi:ABC-type transport system involved in multi-copper enzyme maturation permease subunit